MNTNIFRLSRALVALIFIISGIGKIAGFKATEGMMDAAGLPFPALFLVGAITLEVGGGLALLIGYKARWAALALIIFLIPATIIFHASHIADPVEGQQQMIQVLKNLAILGGLLTFAIDRASALSVRAPRVEARPVAMS